MPREGEASSNHRRSFESRRRGGMDHPLELVIGRRFAPTRWRMTTASYAASIIAPSLPLAHEFRHGGAEFVRVHAIDDGVALVVELLFDRLQARAVDQGFRCCKPRRRVLC